jgi:hypothetical protein
VANTHGLRRDREVGFIDGLDGQCHEYAVGVRSVVAERRALDESMLAIQLTRGMKVDPGARLKTETRHP